MKLIPRLHHLTADQKGAVVTIGNFDGVHRGHQALLKRVIHLAKEMQTHSMLITFEPQPGEFFHKQDAPARLTNLREKLTALQAIGIDMVLCLQFDETLRRLSSDDFIQQILIEALQIKAIVAGEDFQFGCDRKGNLAVLKAASEKGHFVVNTIHAVEESKTRISSTQIRKLLKHGDLVAAGHLLGRAYAIQGRVVYGDKLGRNMGFRTANILLKRNVVTLTGVYAVKVQRAGLHDIIQGVANCGTRPTVCGLELRLEVHLFDFDDDLYGQHLTVTFLKKIRDERRFSSLDELKQQIGKDVEAAEAFFDA